MIIRINATDQGPATELVDPDNFTSFAIARGPDVSTADLEHAVQQIGRPSGTGHVYVEVDALLHLAGDRAWSIEWRTSFDGMCAYAGSKGWVDELGGIRAHIE